MKCRNCGAENPEGLSLCQKCGATLSTIAGAKSIVPEEYLESFPFQIALGVIGFLVMIVGAWIVGGQLGAGIFIALIGTIMVSVAVFYSMTPGSQKLR